MNIKSLIPLSTKLKIISLMQKNNINNLANDGRNNLYVVLAADYGNLGDVAISYAQYYFLQKNFPQYNIVDVPISRNIKNISTIKKQIRKRDVITIVGGGNLTDKYQDIENCRLAWVKAFPKNKIISFPQTIDFGNSEKGQASFDKSKKVYEAHSDFHMFARETVSFNIMKKDLDTNIYLCPDIVLSQNQSEPSFKRNGVVCCIRDDSESIFNDAERLNLIESIRKLFVEDVTFSDTHIGRGNLSWKERSDELNTIWTSFKRSEVVVTDRLHGMIFSVITKTPCVVLLNNNHKIIQTYKDWLENLEHVILLEKPDVESVNESIRKLRLISENGVQLPDLKNKHALLTSVINCEKN
ncbi:polysaccharide pyruvyl transferase family protein [Vibrio splendidus]